MPDEKEEIIKAVTGGAMLAILTGLTKALLSQSKGLVCTIKIFFASVAFGIVASLVLRTTELSRFKKDFIICICTAFCASIFPKAEEVVIKWIKKGDKVNDILSDNSD